MLIAKIICKDGEEIVTTAEEMHQDGDYLVVYAPHCELKAMVAMSNVKTAYLSEKKERKDKK